jgi:membrane protease subunit (stomatin/prohibitin family)
MTVCPDCGVELPEDANFCRSCGSSVGSECPACGDTVSNKADFCPSCGESLSQSSSNNTTTSDSTGAIQLRPAEFARRVDGSELKSGGLLDRLRQKEAISIEEGTRAALLEEGELVGEIGPGKHKLDSLGEKIKEFRRGKNRTVILVADGNTVITLPINNIRTATDYPVDITIELVVRIDDPERFFTNLVADRDAVTTETFDQLLGDAVRDELETVLSEHGHEELYGNSELRDQVQSTIQQKFETFFIRNGLELVDIRSFEYQDGKEEVRQEEKEVKIRAEKEDIEDRRSELDRRQRERDTDDTVHSEKERIKRETTKQAADHEIQSQSIEHEQERDDKQRRHKHKAERENVEHEEEKKKKKKESEVERRELEHEQDVDEIEDLMDLKAKKDQQKLDKKQREQDLEMEKERQAAEVEKERLQARDSVDLDTLASMEDVDEAVAELAEIEKAEDLTPAQLEALGAQDSDELAKARQEANKAEKERQRVEDQKEFREEMKDVMSESMDQLQETTESAMDNMGETGQAAAEDTSDNVIVSDTGGSSDNGDTTIVQGGSDGSGTDEESKVVVCPNCNEDVPHHNDFCTNCGTDI